MRTTKAKARGDRGNVIHMAVAPPPWAAAQGDPDAAAMGEAFREVLRAERAVLAAAEALTTQYRDSLLSIERRHEECYVRLDALDDAQRELERARQRLYALPGALGLVAAGWIDRA